MELRDVDDDDDVFLPLFAFLLSRLLDLFLLSLSVLVLENVLDVLPDVLVLDGAASRLFP